MYTTPVRLGIASRRQTRAMLPPLLFLAVVQCSRTVRSPPGSDDGVRAARSNANTSANVALRAPQRSAVPRRVQTGTTDGVVLDARELVGRGGCALQEDASTAEYVSAAWQPDDDAIHRFELGLPSYLQRNLPRHAASVADRIQAYKRQYLGVVCHGSRALVVHFMCRPLLGWESRLITVADGGECYLTVWYDAERDRFDGLLVNGYA